MRRIPPGTAVPGANAAVAVSDNASPAAAVVDPTAAQLANNAVAVVAGNATTVVAVASAVQSAAEAASGGIAVVSLAAVVAADDGHSTEASSSSGSSAASTSGSGGSSTGEEWESGKLKGTRPAHLVESIVPPRPADPPAQAPQSRPSPSPSPTYLPVDPPVRPLGHMLPMPLPGTSSASNLGPVKPPPPKRKPPPAVLLPPMRLTSAPTAVIVRRYSPPPSSPSLPIIRPPHASTQSLDLVDPTDPMSRAADARQRLTDFIRRRMPRFASERYRNGGGTTGNAATERPRFIRAAERNLRWLLAMSGTTHFQHAMQKHTKIVCTSDGLAARRSTTSLHHTIGDWSMSRHSELNRLGGRLRDPTGGSQHLRPRTSTPPRRSFSVFSLGTNEGRPREGGIRHFMRNLDRDRSLRSASSSSRSGLIPRGGGRTYVRHTAEVHRRPSSTATTHDGDSLDDDSCAMPELYNRPLDRVRHSSLGPQERSSTSAGMDSDSGGWRGGSTHSSPGFRGVRAASEPRTRGLLDAMLELTAQAVNVTASIGGSSSLADGSSRWGSISPEPPPISLSLEGLQYAFDAIDVRGGAAPVVVDRSLAPVVDVERFSDLEEDDEEIRAELIRAAQSASRSPTPSASCASGPQSEYAASAATQSSILDHMPPPRTTSRWAVSALRRRIQRMSRVAAPRQRVTPRTWYYANGCSVNDRYGYDIGYCPFAAINSAASGSIVRPDIGSSSSGQATGSSSSSAPAQPQSQQRRDEGQTSLDFDTVENVSVATVTPLPPGRTENFFRRIRNEVRSAVRMVFGRRVAPIGAWVPYGTQFVKLEPESDRSRSANKRKWVKKPLRRNPRRRLKRGSLGRPGKRNKQPVRNKKKRKLKK